VVMEEIPETKKKGRRPKCVLEVSTSPTSPPTIKRPKTDDGAQLFQLYQELDKKEFGDYIKATYLSNGLHIHLVVVINSYYEQLMTSNAITNEEHELFEILTNLINIHLKKRAALVSHKFSFDQDEYK
jgi:hypothetical protein